jgi:hypothetical protein
MVVLGDTLKVRLTFGSVWSNSILKVRLVIELYCTII